MAAGSGGGSDQQTLRASREAAGVSGEREPAREQNRGLRIGRYVVLERLGAGAMGAVYSAYDPVLDRKIALKLLSGARGDQAVVARLVQEGSTMARLSHPNVVTVHDVGVFDDQPYLAMELVQGQTLAAWQAERPRSVREIALVMAGVARGLAAAHACGVVHRDVKPQNILVAGARVLVTDFGLSVRTDAAAEPGVAGTPGYMAPEQLLGQAVDARTDVFGFCATLYELLHGALPWQGTTLSQVREAVLAGRLAPAPPLPRAAHRLHRLAMRGLARNPEARPADLARLADELLADPGRRVWRGLLVAVGATLVLTAYWGGGELKANPERRCRAGATAIDAAWSPGRREQLRQRFAAAGKAVLWPLTEKHLDRYAAGWRTMYQQNCSATYAERRQSDEIFDLRVDCLDQRRATVSAFVEAVAGAAPERLATASSAASALPLLADCDFSGRPGMKRLPSDPAQAAALKRVEGHVAGTAVATLLGDYPRAERLVAAAMAEARRVGYEPLLSRALAQAAILELRIGRVDDAAPEGRKSPVDRSIALLHEAFAVGELGRDDLRRAVAARELVFGEMLRGRLADARSWANLAAAMIRRIGDPPEQRASLASNVGWLELEVGDRKRAAAAFNEAITLRAKILPPDDPEQLGPVIGLCETYDAPEPKRACFERAVALARVVHGPDHPDTGALYNNMSDLFVRDPATRERGCQLLREALRLYGKTLAPGHHDILESTENLGYCLHQQGKLAEARRTLEDGLARATVPSRQRTNLWLVYGQLLSELGQGREAVAFMRRALQERTALFGASDGVTLKARAALAEVLAAQGQPAPALREVDDGLRLARAEGLDGPPVAELHDQRGTLLLDRPGGAPEARRAFLAALAVHQRSPGAPSGKARSLQGLGLAELADGRSAAAIEALEQALELRGGGLDASPAEWAETAFALARALTADGRDRPRACTLAQAAAAAFAREPTRRAALAQVERWLLGQGCGPRGRA